MKTILSTLGLLSVLTSFTVGAQPVHGAKLPDPWPPGTASDTHWGTTVPDPYRELENVKDERVQRWLRAQGEAGDQALRQLPGRAALLARVQALDADGRGVTGQVTRTDTGRLFFLRRNPDEQQSRLMLRERADADPVKDRVLVDPDALSKAAGRPVAILDYAASPDGSKLAYALQAGGAEIGTLHVVDVASGRELVAPLDRIRGAEARWLPDGSGLFHSRLREGYDKLPATERFKDTGTHFLSLVDGSDRLVFAASRHPELGLPPFAAADVRPVPGRPMAVAVVHLGVDRNLVMLVADLSDAIKGQPRWRKVIDVADEVAEIDLDAGGVAWLRSAKGAPRYQVLRLLLATPEMAKAELVLPQSASVITRMATARDALYLTRRDGVTTSLWRLPVGRDAAALQPVPLPVIGSVGIRHADPAQDGALLLLGGWTQASADYRFDPRDPTVQRLPLARSGLNDNPDTVMAREVMVRSHDGTLVPVSILSRRDLKLDGRNPTILYGYGAYGTVESPSFNPRLLAWLERGGIYALAHVRGGGVFGREWHLAGHKTTKPNTWKDGIAVAEWLIANGYTSRERLATYGGSAGGIFVGRTITERPDLFAAAVASVPVLDTVRSETRANGVANVPEYGTVQRENEFRGLLAMSSYHALKDGVRYPAVLLTHGINDSRVDVWQSAKFAARLQAVNAGVPQARPALMRLDPEAGHGSGASRAQQQERQVDIWAFLLWQFGVPEFQPVKAGQAG